MSIKSRGHKKFGIKIVSIFLLILFGFLGYFLYSTFIAKNTFISPLGKSSMDTADVRKILKKKNIIFSEVVVLSDLSYGVGIPNNGQVRISSQKDINEQASSLQRILNELTIEGKQFKSIDFRFNEPIISF